MNEILLPICLLVLVGGFSVQARTSSAIPDAEALGQELNQLRHKYERRLQQLENRIADLESSSASATNQVPASSVSDQESRMMEARKIVDRECRSATVPWETGNCLDKESPLDDRIDRILEGFLDTSGSYFRAGYGISDKGGGQRLF